MSSSRLSLTRRRRRQWLTLFMPAQPVIGQISKGQLAYRRITTFVLLFAILFSGIGPIPATAAPVGQASPAVTILAPDDGAILDGAVELRANVSDTTASSVEFFYRAHEDVTPTSLGLATLDSSSGFWVLNWDTTTVLDTFNIIDTDGDDVEDTTVNLTKPPTHDELSVVATTAGGNRP